MYTIIDAPGYHGDHVRVLAICGTETEALAAQARLGSPAAIVAGRVAEAGETFPRIYLQFHSYVLTIAQRQAQIRRRAEAAIAAEQTSRRGAAARHELAWLGAARARQDYPAIEAACKAAGVEVSARYLPSLDAGVWAHPRGGVAVRVWPNAGTCHLYRVTGDGVERLS